MTRFGPEVVDRIVAHVNEGHTFVSAAAVCGISLRTIHHWLRRGRDAVSALGQGIEPDEADRPYVDFVMRVYAAEAECAGTAVAAIKKAWMAGDWKAAAWWLERRRNDEYGLKQVVVQETVDAPIDRALLRKLLLEKLAEMDADETVITVSSGSPSSGPGTLRESSAPSAGKRDEDGSAPDAGRDQADLEANSDRNQDGNAPKT